ncbi:MAG: hypothetical protein ACXW5U_07410 [Thermoanaerobaculia bacterium]
MRNAAWIVVLAVIWAASAFGAEVVVDLTKPPGDAPLAYRSDIGSVDVKIANAIPGKSYLVVDESNRRVMIADLGAAPTPAAPCSDAAGRAKAALRGRTTEKEVSEASKAQEVTACTAAEQQAITAQIKSLTTAAIGSYPLVASGKIVKSLQRDGTDTQWKVEIEPQGAAPRPAQTAETIDRLKEVTDKHPSLVVMKCSYASEKCATDELFVNADQDSALYITDVPAGRPVMIRATADEYFPCRALRYNVARYSSSTSVVVVSMHMKRNPLGLFSNRMSAVEVEAASHYGLDFCPGTDRLFQKKSLLANEKPIGVFTGDVRSRHGLTTDAQRLEDVADPRLEVMQPPLNTLPLFVRGKSELVKVDIDFGDERKTFIVPVRYQRFWLDAGGFFVFSRHVDEELEFEEFTSEDTTRTVKRILKNTSTEPVTGIVVNVHPGNFPSLAFQFGIAANQDRLPSYYLGIGARARSIGKRGLATVGVGLAMQQEDRFPNVKAGEKFPADASRLVASRKYGFNPYLSIALGFSFGGVSEKTDVKAGVASSK